jgi:hypothetical protein
VNIEQITAADYIAEAERARNDDSVRLHFERLKRELETHPRIQERLAFEFTALVLETLRSGHSPKGLFFNVVFYGRAVTDHRLDEFSEKLEQIIVSTFKRLDVALITNNETLSLEYTFALALTILRQRRPGKFTNVIERLKKDCLDIPPENPALVDILNRAEKGDYRPIREHQWPVWAGVFHE